MFSRSQLRFQETLGVDPSLAKDATYLGSPEGWCSALLVHISRTPLWQAQLLREGWGLASLLIRSISCEEATFRCTLTQWFTALKEYFIRVTDTSFTSKRESSPQVYPDAIESFIRTCRLWRNSLWKMNFVSFPPLASHGLIIQLFSFLEPPLFPISHPHWSKLQMTLFC